MTRRVHTAIVLVAMAAGLLHTDGSRQCRAETGWRGDGTGRYPDATPPLTWSKDSNVVWKTVMPGKSNASPALGNDRLFVCAEPTTLLCVSLADGKILWQRTNTYADILPPAEVAKAKEDEAKYRELDVKVKALDKKHKEATDKLKKAPADEALKKEVAELAPQVEALRKELKAVDRFHLPSTHDTNGYSTPTPVYDGKNVYVLFGTGTAVCYDGDGNRKWARTIERPTQGYGHSASPVLVGDKFIVHILGISALDAGTGATLWTAPSAIRWGSLVHTRLGDVDLVVTPSGDVVRVADGKVLASQIGKLEYCAPIVYDKVAYFIENGGKAARLTAPEGDKMTPNALWTTQPVKERYYASPVYDDGLIYAVNQKALLSVIDASNGSIVYTNKLNLKGTIYTSITLAGKRIYASGDSGATAVIATGRTFNLLAENNLEEFRSSPVFVGKRMYLRTYKTLYCIEQ